VLQQNKDMNAPMKRCARQTAQESKITNELLREIIRKARGGPEVFQLGS